MTRSLTVGVSAITGLLCLPAPAQQLVNLRVEGPGQVNEHTVTPFRAYARFDDGREYEVTLSTDWSVEPGMHAGINRFGLFEATNVAGDQQERIRAEFEFEQQVAVASHDVKIRDVGMSGTALRFDGSDDRVEVQADLLNHLPLTMEGWFRVDERPEVHHTIICNDRGGHFGHAILINTAGRLGVQRHDGWEWSNAVVELGQWHHAAVVFVPGAYTLYLDGDEVLTNSYNQNAPDGRAIFWIGRNPQDPGGPQNRSLKGWIDEVRVWHVERSQRDIRSAMNVLLRGDEPGLVGYWRFDEGTGQVVQDLSAFGNDGFLGADAEPEGDEGDPLWDVSAAAIDPGECTNVNCDAISKLKVKCRNRTLKVIVKSSLDPGTELTIDNDGDERLVATNAKGKAKAAWDNQVGIHTVSIRECPERVKAVNCN